jgi:hypothetical protein
VYATKAHVISRLTFNFQAHMWLSGLNLRLLSASEACQKFSLECDSIWPLILPLELLKTDHAFPIFTGLISDLERYCGTIVVGLISNVATLTTT